MIEITMLQFFLDFVKKLKSEKKVRQNIQKKREKRNLRSKRKKAHRRGTGYKEAVEE